MPGDLVPYVPPGLVPMGGVPATTDAAQLALVQQALRQRALAETVARATYARNALPALGAGAPVQSAVGQAALANQMGAGGIGGAGAAGAGAIPAEALAGAGGAGGAAGGAGVAGLAGEAAGAAGGAGALSRFAPTLTRGALMRGAGYAGLGLVGGGIVNKLNIGGEGSNADQALTGAATGAGIGAGVGSIVPGIGTGIGALAGGVIGAGIGLFGPKHDPNAGAAKALAAEQPRLMQLMNAAGISQDQQALLWQTYNFGLAAARDEKGKVTKDAVTQLDQAMVQGIQNVMLQNQIEASTALANEKRKQQLLGLLVLASRSGVGGTGIPVDDLSKMLQARISPLQQAASQSQQNQSALAQALG